VTRLPAQYSGGQPCILSKVDRNFLTWLTYQYAGEFSCRTPPQLGRDARPAIQKLRGEADMKFPGLGCLSLFIGVQVSATAGYLGFLF